MNIVMLGGHATGKSSYVVGLFGGLSNGVFSNIELRGVHDPVNFLNAGLERLGRREPVERSDTAGAEVVSLTVALGNGVEHKLSIPDRSGEALKNSLNLREWDAGLASDFGQAEGILCFIHPMVLEPGGTTDEVAALLPGEVEDDGDEIPEPWSPAMTPTDVRMVDALQEVREIVDVERLPVGLVVSAWDEVASPDWTPRDWRDRRVPLLAQFLETNDEAYPSECFGVSVQGGSFADGRPPGPDEDDPWDRAWAVDSAGVPVELSEPLEWLLRSRAPE